YLLKKSLEPVLPRDIIYRPKKGFGVPIGQWIRDGYLAFDQKSDGILNSQFISQRLDDHCRGRADQRHFLWNAWLLSTWSGKGF
ncbi:MAG TPA: asparagine synthase-related protein, partial [Desulfobaccales bacterium]